jgi:hypothetical protein
MLWLGVQKCPGELERKICIHAVQALSNEELFENRFTNPVAVMTENKKASRSSTSEETTTSYVSRVKRLPGKSCGKTPTNQNWSEQDANTWYICLELGISEMTWIVRAGVWIDIRLLYLKSNADRGAEKCLRHRMFVPVELSWRGGQDLHSQLVVQWDVQLMIILWDHSTTELGTSYPKGFCWPSCARVSARPRRRSGIARRHIPKRQHVHVFGLLARAFQTQCTLAVGCRDLS